MKASQKNFAAQMTRAAAEASVFYFCGPDEAGASDAAARLSAHIAAQQGAFERVELAGADLRRDPVRLADEARSVSLFGDTRQIHIRCAGDEAFDAVETLLASPVAGWPVFILATSASDKSRIAKLLSDRPDALVTMFHPPDTGTVTTAVREMADRAGLRLSNDLAERIARALRSIPAWPEVRLKSLPCSLMRARRRRARPIRPRSTRSVPTSEDDSFMPLVNTVLTGDTQRLSAELARMHELELNPVGLLLAFERRAAQSAQLAGRLRGRSDINAFLEQEMAARRVFFRDKADLAHQSCRWRDANGLGSLSGWCSFTASFWQIVATVNSLFRKGLLK